MAAQESDFHLDHSKLKYALPNMELQLTAMNLQLLLDLSIHPLQYRLENLQEYQAGLHYQQQHYRSL
jgi:hypothetical protein